MDRVNGRYDPRFGGRGADPLRSPPYNAEAEAGVIGSFLIDNDAYHVVSAIVRAEDFFDESLARIYRVAARLMDEQGELDALTLAEALVTAGLYPRHEGRGLGPADEVVTGLIHSTVHAANAVIYAGLVRQKATARRLAAAARRIEANAYADTMNADEQMEAAQKLILVVAEDAPRARTFTAYDAGVVAMEAFLLRRGGHVSGVRTGFARLDDMLGGSMARKSLVLVGDGPSMGKTSMGLNICENAAEAGVGSYFASLEMKEQELGDRLLCGRARVPLHEFKRAKGVTDEQEADLCAALADLKRVRIDINDSPSQTVTRIAAEARREKIAGGIGLVLIDYIQFVPVDLDDRQLARHIQLAKMSQRLKTLAADLDLPVVVLSQLNRDCDGREDKRPRMSDLKESGALEQDADVVLLLHRPDYYDKGDRPGVVEVIVAKNRNGPTGIVELGFVGPLTRFMDRDENGDLDYL